jgi:peptidoglycan hydrolase-like protein with peptidoglycan-binding domain
MHLVGSGERQLPVTGIFGRKTYRAVRSFQTGAGLRADGVIGSATWRRLLRVAPYRPHWAGSARPAARPAASVAPARPRAPLSATLPAKADELAAKPGP